MIPLIFVSCFSVPRNFGDLMLAMPQYYTNSNYRNSQFKS
jgi:hypothetical protein